MTGTAVAMAHWQHRGAGTTLAPSVAVSVASEARPRTLGPSRRWQRAAQATAGMYCDSWALAQEVALNCKSRRLAAAFMAQVVRAGASSLQLLRARECTLILPGQIPQDSTRPRVDRFACVHSP